MCVEPACSDRLRRALVPGVSSHPFDRRVARAGKWPQQVEAAKVTVWGEVFTGGCALHTSNKPCGNDSLPRGRCPAWGVSASAEDIFRQRALSLASHQAFLAAASTSDSGQHRIDAYHTHIVPAPVQWVRPRTMGP